MGNSSSTPHNAALNSDLPNNVDPMDIERVYRKLQRGKMHAIIHRRI